MVSFEIKLFFYGFEENLLINLLISFATISIQFSFNISRSLKDLKLKSSFHKFSLNKKKSRERDLKIEVHLTM